MPKQKNILQFSVPQDTLNQLENLRQDGESISMCAKRLLLESLNNSTSDQSEVNDQSDLDERVTDVEKQNEILTKKLLYLEESISEMKQNIYGEVFRLRDENSRLQDEVIDGHKMIAHLQDWIHDDDQLSQKIGLVTSSFELGFMEKSDYTHDQILTNENIITNSEMTIANSDDGENYPNDPPAVDDFVQNLSPEKIELSAHSAQSFSQTNPLRSYRRQKRLLKK